MGILNAVLGRIFDILFLPFRGLSPWFGMAVISLLSALLMLFIFRKTSNQEGIRRTKNRIKAHLLELRLFKDSMAVSLKAQKNILLANLRYVAYNAKPMLVMIVPILLILIQLNLWFGYAPLQPGLETLVKVRLEKGYNPMELDLTLETPAGIVLETPPVRIEDESEISWRLRAGAAGPGELRFRSGSREFVKKVAVGGLPLSKISPLKVKGLADQFFNPGESPLPKDLPIKSVEIRYPPARLSFFGWRVHWLVAYFLLSIIVGFSLKGVFKVEI